MPKRPKTDNLLKIAMRDLGLDPADKVDRDVRRVLQSLWSIVHGIASLRTLGGSAHGHGRRSYRLQARHARLAVQSFACVYRVLRRNLELPRTAALVWTEDL